MRRLTPNPEFPWLETQARVTSCKYDFGEGRALAFGIPTSKHFLITFSYYAHGKTYTGEFTSRTYLEQGKTFNITYNPLAPQQNNRAANIPDTKTPLFAIGIIGSVILSLVWFAMMRGCH
ncbi:hypothetical protein [Edaphobacter dinghuensis]|uniref:DUF3592 domain-containing protein n=1 Tax=Edaphobacter dinghuensis TaxID=1560005 RepID=A0A917M7M3_9BACT|nr:hypothetical protein [Edaphobacter dinghuensis]GGG82914.1 hypothetical protein GCM10011585_28190 [Edaphobacter dinghuensis]